jgi:molecular chaperone GrpE
VTESGEQPVFRDRRRIDPETGQVREPQAAAAPPSDPDPAARHVDPSWDPDVQATTGAPPVQGTSAGAGRATEQEAQPERVAELEASLAERTLDLQRLQAEYVNYKRRVDRDREVVRDTATAGVLTALLPVLDDIDRARDHGELEGGFKAVADSLGRVITGLGLERFGEPGEPFDPRLHEALMHSHADGVDGPTCTMILQPGYRMGERILRPARVAVAEPSTDPAGAPVESADDAPATQAGQADEGQHASGEQTSAGEQGGPSGDTSAADREQP